MIIKISSVSSLLLYREMKSVKYIFHSEWCTVNIIIQLQIWLEILFFE